MGPKAVKLESTIATTTAIVHDLSKKEEKISVKSEENLTESAAMIDSARYVHDNPRSFKGRLGYA